MDLSLDTLRDQIRDQAQAAWNRLQESPAYLSLAEQFEGLPLGGQKAVIYLGIALAALGLFMIPYSFVSSSSSLVEEYEESRILMRDLLHIARDGNLPPPLPPTVDASVLQGQFQSALQPFTLLPEQLGAIQPMNANPAGPLVAKKIEQTGVSVQLLKLNLHQIIDLGSALQNITPSLRMMGLEVQNNRDDNRYYDVVFQFVNFTLPQTESSGSEGDQ